ncbi:MAG: acyloxyacyl hydrolase [Deltaproteobacteria bacterium]|nr:MAG: acyloxyacyl hydrolase [Deltaproteobacteria bacterium]
MQRYNFKTFLHDSITPPLHYSSCLPCEGKTPKAPSRGSSRPGPLGLDSLLLVVFVMFFTTVSTPAIATEPVPEKNGVGWLHEIRVGVLAHDVNHLWSGTRKEGGVDINGEIIFGRPSFSLLSGSVRPNFGASINTEGDTSKIYGGILWEVETKSGIFFDLGVGIAVHNGELDTDDEDQKSLGSSVLFRIPIEIGYSITEHHRISILFDHISNAHLADPNEGLDTLGLRYGYRF